MEKADRKKILLTGATGYVGKRLLPVLIDEGYHVICCIRDKTRFSVDGKYGNQVEILEIDFLKPPNPQSFLRILMLLSI